MIHPILPCGYNSWEIDGDEIDGAGVNEPIWPVLFDTFEAKEVLFLTEDMLEVFETACPDYVVGRDVWEVQYGFEDMTVTVGDAWPVHVVPEVSNTISMPREDRSVTVDDKWGEYATPAVGNLTQLSHDGQVYLVRKVR